MPKPHAGGTAEFEGFQENLRRVVALASPLSRSFICSSKRALIDGVIEFRKAVSSSLTRNRLETQHFVWRFRIALCKWRYLNRMPHQETRLNEFLRTVFVDRIDHATFSVRRFICDAKLRRLFVSMFQRKHVPKDQYRFLFKHQNNPLFRMAFSNQSFHYSRRFQFSCHSFDKKSIESLRHIHTCLHVRIGGVEFHVIEFLQMLAIDAFITEDAPISNTRSYPPNQEAFQREVRAKYADRNWSSAL